MKVNMVIMDIINILMTIIWDNNGNKANEIVLKASYIYKEWMV